MSIYITRGLMATLIGNDGLHPTESGYRKIADCFSPRSDGARKTR
jgi:lysophospholipase L1-like esterase